MSLPEVVFVHGAGGGAWEWCVWQQGFNEHGWTTLAVNLTPHAKGLKHTRLDHYLDQIVNLLNTRDIKNPVLVGASMGAMLALRTADYLQASAYVLVNPVPPADIQHWTPPDEIPDIVPWSRSDFASTERSLFDASEAMQQYAHANWRDESGFVLRDLYRQTAIPRPHKPVLIVLGEADDDIPPEAGNELAEYLHAEVASYARVSHVGALLGEQARKIADDTCLWLERKLETPMC